MRACEYCGRENETGASRCRECGTPFAPAASTELARTPVLPRAVRMRIERLFPYFSRLHGRIFLGFYLVFAVLAFLVLLPGSLSGHGDSLGLSVAASVAAVTGPFTGAIARGGQSCCLHFSLRVLPFCAAAFTGGLLFQIVPLPVGRMEHRIRISMWCLGLLGWFAGIPISFLHALS